MVKFNIIVLLLLILSVFIVLMIFNKKMKTDKEKFLLIFSLVAFVVFSLSCSQLYSVYSENRNAKIKLDKEKKLEQAKKANIPKMEANKISGRKDYSTLSINYGDLYFVPVATLFNEKENSVYVKLRISNNRNKTVTLTENDFSFKTITSEQNNVKNISKPEKAKFVNFKKYFDVGVAKTKIVEVKLENASSINTETDLSNLYLAYSDRQSDLVNGLNLKLVSDK